MIRAFLKKVGLLSNKAGPAIIPRVQHGISRKDISENALKVLYRLRQKGYGAYLVGGGVRDLLLGLHPKDFDIVTDAKPEEIRRIFRNCRLIGRRFRLAHIYFGHDIIEVATFRGKSDTQNSEEISHSSHGMILRDNVYGTLEEDVFRRDFTINAIYYNIADFSLVDHCGGFADLKAKRLRMIGDVETRYREDPVRMLRAIRFASKLGFSLCDELTTPMQVQKDLVSHIAPARLFEEMIKMFHSGVAANVYSLLKQYDLFAILFPATHDSFSSAFPVNTLLEEVFLSTDQRVQEHKTVTPAFILAALLWYPICIQANSAVENGATIYVARQDAIDALLRLQTKTISLPKRIVQGARDIWVLQMRLSNRQPKRIMKMLSEPKIRAGVDFLELRAKAGENVDALAKWWRQMLEGDNATRNRLMKSISGDKRRKRKKKVKISEDNN